MIQFDYNRKITGTLANLSAGGRLPPAILLEGPAGIGKKTAAALIAQMCLCVGEPKPCGTCAHCVKIEKHIHPDVRYFTVPNGKKEFPIELVRQIRQDAIILPNEGAGKIYILDQAHTMNEAAQNALLKIIEEPPKNVRFILLCENRSRMLVTILSRVVSMELELPTPEQCAKTLARLAPDRSESEREAAAAGAGGNIGQALELLGTAKPSKAAADTGRLQETLLFSDRYQALKILAAYDKDRNGLIQLCTLLREAFARLAAAHYSKSGADARLTNRITAMQALEIADRIGKALDRARQNVSIPLICGCMLEEIKGILA